MGAGTGLGETYLANSESCMKLMQVKGVWQSSVQLLKSFGKCGNSCTGQDGHVTVEGLVSGPGIANICSYPSQ